MTAANSSKLRLWRFAAIGLGILWLFWLPFEDTSLRLVIIFALAISGLLAARLFLSPFASKLTLSKTSTDQTLPGAIRRYFFYILLGVFAGVAVTVVGLLLMTFKTGLHGHATPDFTIEQVIDLVWLTPVWVLGGTLISLGIATWRYRPE